MTTTPQQPDGSPSEEVISTEELIRRQGVRPLRSGGDLADVDPFESDEEYGEFLADLYTSRRGNSA